MNLWEVQGSYLTPFVAGRNSYRANMRLIIACTTGIDAMRLWENEVPKGAGAPEIHQLIKRNASGVKFIINWDEVQTP